MKDILLLKKSLRKRRKYLWWRQQNYILEVVQCLLLKQEYNCFRTSVKNKKAAIVSLYSKGTYTKMCTISDHLYYELYYINFLFPSRVSNGHIFILKPTATSPFPCKRKEKGKETTYANKQDLGDTNTLQSL